MRIILYTWLFICSNSLLSQHKNILISDTGDPNEPTIMFSEDTPSLMIAACNIDKYYISKDAGLTWETRKQQSSYGVWGDPVLITDDNGSFYYFHLSNPPDGSWIDRIVCQRSDDDGNTWNNGTYTGLDGKKAQDKEWAVFDKKSKEIMLTWTQFDKYGSEAPTDSSSIMFSKTSDRGETWSPAKRINEINGDCIDSDNTVEGAVPAVGPNGEIYVAWAGPEGLVFDRSEDGGETWLEKDVKVANIGGGWNYTIPGIMRSNGLPVTKCDLSGGPHHGTIYISWSDQSRGDDDTDVWIVKSTDKGDTWTQPKRVNDDEYGSHQFFSWIDVDQTNGYLYCVFYDRRNYDDDRTDVYMASSVDGGENFYNFKVSQAPFLSGSNTIFFGDYTNVMAHNNVIRPIWTRLDDEKLSIWTAIIDPQKATLQEASSRTVSEPKSIKWRICKPKQMKIVLYNHHTQEELLIQDWTAYPKGKSELQINLKRFTLESDFYECRLYMKGQSRYKGRKIRIKNAQFVGSTLYIY